MCHARVSRDKGSGQIAFAYFYGLTERTQQKVYIMLQKCKLYNFKVFFSFFFGDLKKKLHFFLLLTTSNLTTDKFPVSQFFKVYFELVFLNKNDPYSSDKKVIIFFC